MMSSSPFPVSVTRSRPVAPWPGARGGARAWDGGTGRRWRPEVAAEAPVSRCPPAATELEETLYGVLNLLPFGVLVTQRDGTLVAANQAALRVLERRVVLRLGPGGRLQAVSPRDARRLAAAMGADGARRPAGSDSFPLEAVDGASRWIALRKLAQDGVGEDRSVLFIGEGQAPLPSLELLSAVHGLTPAEGRLAVALVEGGGLGEVAARLRTSRNTVKSQLQGIFQKTGARRQSELVRLLLDPVACL
jgi:DNA-binding CsgD family transcriptional regulator